MLAGDRLIKALEHATFPPGTASKRFVRDLCAAPADLQLSERQEAFAWRIAYTFRRQLPNDLKDEALSRKVSHVPISCPDKNFHLECSTCGSYLDRRNMNAPCRGKRK